MRKRTIVTFAAGLLLGLGIGLACGLFAGSEGFRLQVPGLIEVDCADPSHRRMIELLEKWEESKAIQDEWERIWFEDMAKKDEGKPNKPK